MQGGGPTPGSDAIQRRLLLWFLYSCSLVQGEERHPGEEQRGPLPPDQERGHREVSLKKTIEDRNKRSSAEQYFPFEEWRGVCRLWYSLSILRPNSETKSRQKSQEFSSLLFTFNSTGFPWDLYFYKLTQPLTVSTVFSYWTVHCKGERRKTWCKNQTPFPMV